MNERFDVLQGVLDNFARVLGAGGGQLQDMMHGWAALFLAFALLWLCYGIICDGHRLSGAIGLLIRASCVLWAIDNWPGVLSGLQELGLQFGLDAVSATLDAATFLNPGNIVRMGINTARPIYKAFQVNSGLTTAVTATAFLLMWISFVGAYCTIAFKIFWHQIEALLAALAGICLLPALMFRPTSFVAAGTLSFAANMFARFLLSGILAGGLWSYLGSVTGAWWNPGGAPVPPLAPGATLDISIQQAFAAVMTVWVFAWCFLSVNRLAGMLTSGIPALSGTGSLGTLMRTLVGGVSTAMAAGATIATGALGVGRAGAAVGQALIGASRNVGSAWQLATGQAIYHGAHPMQAAVRQLYAGARDGASGGMQAQLGTYMHRTATVAAHSGGTALREFMGTGRSLPADQSHHGVRH